MISIPLKLVNGILLLKTIMFILVNILSPAEKNVYALLLDGVCWFKT